MRNYPGLDEEQRQAVADGLAHVLADTYALYFKTHGFHWNVTGPNFFGLHAMFEEQYREMWGALDGIAERIRALGHPAPGSAAALGKLASVRPQEEVPAAAEMIAELIEGHETVMGTVRTARTAAQEADDEASLALLASRLEAHEKMAWMLASTEG